MKNILKAVLLLSVFCAIVGMISISYKKIETSRITKEKLSTQPTFPLLALDSSSIDISKLEEKTLVLIHFNSECDHCQYETADIKKNIEKFTNATLVFMSSEPLTTIKAFAAASGLGTYNNVSFTQISSNDAFTSFGSLSVPHVFVYGPDKILRKEFKGETKAEAILKYLN